MDKVFKRFGILVEVPIDHNMKICEEFQKFYEKTLIDHYIIHKTILKANGLIEYMVKYSLCKVWASKEPY
jgi:hypothetical protein